MKNTIKEMPKEARPYEKFYTYGAESLMDFELLAIILKTGTIGISSIDLARQILDQGEESGLITLLHMSTEQLQQINGVGRVKAMQLTCIAELSRRIAKCSISEGLTFANPETVALYYMEDMRHKEREELRVFFLNSKNVLIKEICMSVGTVSQSFCSPREVFIEALKCRAVNLCLMHNHPSGDPTPSHADFESTDRMCSAGKLLGISVVDHIIIGDNKYISFRQKGYLK